MYYNLSTALHVALVSLTPSYKCTFAVLLSFHKTQSNLLTTQSLSFSQQVIQASLDALQPFAYLCSLEIEKFELLCSEIYCISSLGSLLLG